MIKLLFVALVFSTLPLSAATKIHYTCSMHPHIHEDKPGKCPICHMNLTKIETEIDIPKAASSPADAPKLNPTDVIGRVRLRKAQLSHFKPEYFPVTTMRMNKKIRLLGSVLQSEEKESSIPARIDGRVEKVYIKSTGSLIKVGDPVVDLYSPKLITAGEEYLLASRSYSKQRSREFKEMLSQSAQRLRLWGIKKTQIQSWVKANKVPRNITIYSDTTGIVRNKKASVGKYFKEGQNFFELSDLSDVWVEMGVYEQDSALVKIGQQVELEFTALPGDSVMGEIDFINPVLDAKSRTLKIRSTVKNDTATLKPGMIASATLNITLPGTPLVVPRSAIIDTGKRKVVWIRISDREFQAKVIQSGFESEGYVEIKKGLSIGQSVVIEGSFLLDAQAQLFGGYEEMTSENQKHSH